MRRTIGMAALAAALWLLPVSEAHAQVGMMMGNPYGAGAYYGASQIPARWLEKLAMRAEITELADQLESRPSGNAPRPG